MADGIVIPVKLATNDFTASINQITKKLNRFAEQNKAISKEQKQGMESGTSSIQAFAGEYVKVKKEADSLNLSFALLS